MSDHGNIADILSRGIKAISEGIDELASMPKEGRSERYHWRNLSLCVEAAARVQAEIRDQTEFESKTKLAPADIRKAVLEFFADLSADEKRAFLAEAGMSMVSQSGHDKGARPHA